MPQPSRTAFIAVTVTMLFTAVIAAGDSPPFQITTKRDNDQVKVTAEKDKTVFSIHSPFGISQAVIERADTRWSDAVVLRLHLKGLESFRATNGKITLNAAVSGQNGIQRFRLWKDGKEDSLLDTQSPFWMEIRMLGGDGKPARTIPLKDGYFEMQLPKAFFEDNPKSITVNWIDFHR